MNIALLLALVAFVAMRGGGFGSNGKLSEPKSPLYGYSGFAYFPLFAPAKPMEDDVPYFYDRTDREANAKWNAWIQTLTPGNYYLSYMNDQPTHVYERVGAYEVKRIGQYNPDLRKEVVDGVAVDA